MIKDTLNSVFDNLKERTTNPFLGTLIVVWVIHNWKLVYSLLYFDGNFRLKDRLQYITNYYKDCSFIGNMLIVILITLGVLILTYALLTLSRLLTDFYDRVVIPWVSKITDKSTVVLKSDYSKLIEDVKRLEVRLEEERIAKFNAQNERDRAELKLAEFKNAVVPETPSKNNDAYLERIVTSLSREHSVDDVNKVIETLQNENGIKINDPIVRQLLREDLIGKTAKSYSNEYAGYVFNDEGKKFVRYWNSKKAI